MRNTIAIAALAGLATVAAAQTGPTLNVSLVPAQTTLNQGQSTTVSIVLSWTGQAPFSNLVSFSLDLDMAGDSDLSNFVPQDIAGAFPGVPPLSGLIVNSTPEQLDEDLLVLIDTTGGDGQFGLLSYPATIATFTLTAGQEVGVFSLTGSGRDTSVGSVVLSTLGGTTVNFFGDLDTYAAGDGLAIINGASITVVPTPGAAALLGLGGVAALRRRR